MSYPVHTPLSADPGADQVAGLLLYFETFIEPAVRLTPVVVQRLGGAVDARVIVAIGHGGRIALNPAECRLVAWCLIHDGDYAGAAHYAQAFLDAGAEADARRQALRLGVSLEAVNSRAESAGWTTLPTVSRQRIVDAPIPAGLRGQPAAETCDGKVVAFPARRAPQGGSVA